VITDETQSPISGRRTRGPVYYHPRNAASDWVGFALLISSGCVSWRWVVEAGRGICAKADALLTTMTAGELTSC
jgi:hypothetical protein